MSEKSNLLKSAIFINSEQCECRKTYMLFQPEISDSGKDIYEIFKEKFKYIFKFIYIYIFVYY